MSLPVASSCSPTAIDHLVILVSDMDSAIDTWCHKLGLPLSHTIDLEDVGIRQAFLCLNDSTFIELVAPLRTDSPVSDLLKTNGEGLHVLTLRVESLEASVEDFQRQGLSLRGVGTGQVFVEASSANGILIQLWPADRPHRWRDNADAPRKADEY